MFIPIYILHIIAGIIFLIGLCWAVKQDSAYDFFIIFKLPFILLLYAIYWIVFLLITGHK